MFGDVAITSSKHMLDRVRVHGLLARRPKVADQKITGHSRKAAEVSVYHEYRGSGASTANDYAVYSQTSL